MTKLELLDKLAPYPDDTLIMVKVGVQCENDDIDTLTEVRAPEGEWEKSRVSPGEVVVVLDTRVW